MNNHRLIKECPVIFEVTAGGTGLVGALGSEFIDECGEGCLIYVKEEIENGADPKFRGSYGLQVAAANGFLDIVEYLVERGCDVNENLPAQQALHNGHTHVVKYLVSKGASIGTVQMGLLEYCDEDVLEFLHESKNITAEQFEKAKEVREVLAKMDDEVIIFKDDGEEDCENRKDEG